jgi:hypothetical protein
MAVRAKFTVQKIERMNTRRATRKPDGTLDWQNTVPDELQTVILSPVAYDSANPNGENSQFWQASPSGEIRLGTINREAFSHFELGAEYYIDFTRAE